MASKLPTDTSTAPRQRYLLRLGGHDYVATTCGRLRTEMVLYRDGVQVLRGTTVETSTKMTPGEPDEREPGVEVDLRRTRTGRVKRLTLHAHGREVDLEPESGSPAARRLQRERRHPWAYASLDVLAAVVGVLLPLLGIGAFIKLVLAPVVEWLLGLLPDIDLPSIPWPDIPWPSVDIPWPRLDLSWIPDWTPPGWFVWLLDHAGEVKPVLFALIIAVYEVRRRQRQDREKHALVELEREEALQRPEGARQSASEGSAPTGQRDDEADATPLRAVDADGSAGRADDLVHARQSQP